MIHPAKTRWRNYKKYPVYDLKVRQRKLRKNNKILSLITPCQIPILLIIIVLLGSVVILSQYSHQKQQEQHIEEIYWHIDEVEMTPVEGKEYHSTWKLEFNHYDNTITGKRCDTTDATNQFIDHITGKFYPAINASRNSLQLEYTWSYNEKPYLFEGELKIIDSKKQFSGIWHSTDQIYKHLGKFDSVPTSSQHCLLDL